ncbi:MAG TPA: chemotaxis protein CheW [Burkholderiaceae bacterium]|nr:chemotaxis protein CheW [Burkholderiaceae bacterium]
MDAVNAESSSLNAHVSPLIPKMESVRAYREESQRLQDGWNQLSLLAQMTGSSIDIEGTGAEFKHLNTMLLSALASRLVHNAERAMRAKAQVAIDILIRNLFERTADIGFLAADAPIREFLAADASVRGELRASLEERFRAYVEKYSVYDDVMVLSSNGDVLARLDHRHTIDRSHHDFVSTTVNTQAAFVETFDAVDVLSGRQGLLYSAPVYADRGRAPLGVLALSFKVEDELRAIFTRLVPPDDATVLALVDDAGTVLASSDRWQLPVGAPLSMVAREPRRICFAGREYLSVCVDPAGYQGYSGPGWRGLALLPVELAFRKEQQHAMQVPDTLNHAMTNSTFFGDELARIPVLARTIQRRLERSVWNGQVRGCGPHRQGTEANFAAVLLQQVAVTGAQVTSVFENATAELRSAALASIIDEARFCSALAIDIMDRNLYERANDCRWWVLDSVIQRALHAPDPTHAAEAVNVLRHINELYTVYTRLVLLDRQGRVVATSGNDQTLNGQSLNASWVSHALQLRGRQDYAVSDFEPSRLYGDRHTFIYCASVPGPHQGEYAAGALAIVFDGEPQFAAMLRDALPRDVRGEPLAQADALFVDRMGVVIASTTKKFSVGACLGALLEVDDLRDLAKLKRGESRGRVVRFEDGWYALGITMSAGYREYRCSQTLAPNDIASVVLVRLCDAVLDEGLRHVKKLRASTKTNARSSAAHHIDLAAFMCMDEWLALPAAVAREAIEVDRLTPLPARSGRDTYVVMHEGNPLPVFDLARLRGLDSACTADEHKCLVIVCQLDDGCRLGLRVDELAGVMTVDRGALQPVSGCVAAHDPLARAVVRMPDDGAGSLLTVLGLEHLSGTAMAAVAPRVAVVNQA